MRGLLRLETLLLDQRHSLAYGPTVETAYLVAASVESRSCHNRVSETARVLFRKCESARDNITILNHDGTTTQEVSQLLSKFLGTCPI
jgi:hypothetical protein